MKRTILHFSTNESARLTRQLILTKAGYSVFSADSEMAALSLAELEPCDALIICSSVPPERGQEIAQSLRLRHKDVVVIAFGDQHRRVADISINEFISSQQWLKTLSSVFANQLSGLLSVDALAEARRTKGRGIPPPMRHWKT